MSGHVYTLGSALSLPVRQRLLDGIATAECALMVGYMQGMATGWAASLLAICVISEADCDAFADEALQAARQRFAELAAARLAATGEEPARSLH